MILKNHWIGTENFQSVLASQQLSVCGTCRLQNVGFLKNPKILLADGALRVTCINVPNVRKIGASMPQILHLFDIKHESCLMPSCLFKIYMFLPCSVRKANMHQQKKFNQNRPRGFLRYGNFFDLHGHHI